MITVYEVYGFDNPEIPSGYKATGEFRKPGEGDGE